MTTIGIMPLFDEDRDSLWMIPGYMQMLEGQGALPLMLPLTDSPALLEASLALCDGFLLTGGQDVSPALYGEEVLPVCGGSFPPRDAMDSWFLGRAIELDKPLLGICRGIQIMNVFLGGTLWQDLPSQRPTSVEHHMTKPYHRAVHKVRVIGGTALADILGAGEMGVNSLHHQGVKETAPRCQVTAVSEDGLVEGICLPDRRFFHGVQWHPELSFRTEEKSRLLVRAFVQAASGN